MPESLSMPPEKLEEFEDLLAYDWQDDRGSFLARVKALYDWAEHHPSARAAMADRVSRIAGQVRPQCDHPQLWPLAFLLGQDEHVIRLDPDFESLSTYLYRGRYYAVPVGVDVTPQAIKGNEVGPLMSDETAELLYDQIRGLPDPASTIDGELSAFGPDIPWVAAGSFQSDPILVGSHGTHNIVEYVGRFWAIPQSLGPFNLKEEANRSHPEIGSAETKEQLIAQLAEGAPDHHPAAGDDSGTRLDGSPQASAPPPPPASPPEPMMSRATNPLLPHTAIAEHTYAKVIGERKLISVVIPYFRKKSTVFQCLEALREQDYKLCGRDDIEIIIIDDGTSDETIYSHLPDDVHYVWQKKIQYGICRAKNTGAKLSNGRYIAFVDPDVLVGRGYFDSILRGFSEFGDRIVQAGYVWDYFFTGCPDARTEFGIWENPGHLTSRFYQVAGLNMAIARNLFFETPGFDEDLIYGGVEDILFGYHVGLLPNTAVLFNREMEVRHIPHPPAGAHADPGRTWQIVKRKWPECYLDFIEKGSR